MKVTSGRAACFLCFPDILVPFPRIIVLIYFLIYFRDQSALQSPEAVIFGPVCSGPCCFSGEGLSPPPHTTGRSPSVLPFGFFFIPNCFSLRSSRFSQNCVSLWIEGSQQSENEWTDKNKAGLPDFL